MSPKLADQCTSGTGNWLKIATFCLLSAACSAQNPTVSADVPRRAVPIPACVTPLPVRAASQKGFMRQLSDAQLWQAVFPSFDAEKQELTKDAPACTGEFVFQDPKFEGARLRRPWPFSPVPGDLVFGAGPKRTKIVWFKTHEWDDGSVGGVIAMVRAEEDFAEVYGVGTFRGAPDRSRFATERVGGSVVVTAVDDRCTGKAPEEPCESWIRLLMPWKGQLAEQASIAVERRQISENGEAGATGATTYRMTGTPIFEPTRVRLLEQIQAVDSTGRKLRNVELERQFDFVSGRLVERQPSLWDRVVGAQKDDIKGKPTNSGAAEAKGQLNQPSGASGDDEPAKGASTSSAKAAAATKGAK